ncbi:MAG TPA: hypothetical protein VMF67_19115 [Rhizomicrobium sp.]|nr:hypothetical protein [Rhizomicrobium sp.]
MGLSRLYYHGWQSVFMGSRLARYRDLLRHLTETGYSFWKLSEFAEAVDRGESFDSPVCLLRNDIDSDPGGAALMFACDRAAGVRATYFFRLSTLDAGLAQQIAAGGGEVGYHFEEIATAAKRLGLRSRRQIEVHIERIREDFRSNVHRFGAVMGTNPRVVAAHGDFVNRRIGIPNHYLLDRKLMDELGIVADAYDARVHGNLQARFSDWPAPRWWNPADPVAALQNRPATISILVHPRQWTCNPVLNLRLDARRLCEEASWRWRSTRMARQNVPPVPSSVS